MKKLKIDVDGKEYEVGVEEKEEGKFTVELDKKKYFVSTEELVSDEEEKHIQKSSSGGSKTITSPITGTIGRINTKEGKTVKEGDVLITLIAMKMENEIKSQLSGKVKKILVEEGQNINAGEKMIELE